MEELRSKIEELIESYINVPNTSYFINHEKGINGYACYEELIDELLKLLSKNK